MRENELPQHPNPHRNIDAVARRPQVYYAACNSSKWC